MWNLDVGRITGIPIRLNVTVLLFLPVIAWLIASGEQIGIYADLVAGISPHSPDVDALMAGETPLLIGAVGAIGLFVSVLVHELGHSWMARRYGIAISSITLWIFGGMAHMEDLPEDWNVEFWVAIAGPVTSVLLGGAFYVGLLAVPADPVVVFVFGYLALINVVLAVFNMLPAFPMDGGRILRALLARKQPYARATRTAATVGKGFAILMGFLGVFGNPLLILIALFVYVAASAESRATVLRDLLRGVTAGDLMNADVTAVERGATVGGLVERVVRERRTVYPVVDDRGGVVGIVTLSDVRDVPEGQRGTRTVADVMDPDPTTVSPDDDAFDALVAFGGRDDPLLVTGSDDRLLGVITQEDVERALEVIQGLRKTPDPREVVPEGYA